METTMTRKEQVLVELAARRDMLYGLTVKYAPKSELGKKYRKELKAAKEAVYRALDAPAFWFE